MSKAIHKLLLFYVNKYKFVDEKSHLSNQFRHAFCRKLRQTYTTVHFYVIKLIFLTVYAINIIVENLYRRCTIKPSIFYN